ncbi:MAG: hypothetical protein GF346_07145 [Candidatus Eisenbacteria bacterium]|nr:hypothetical protein [Candidatus Latescibacterota bacterium]MBD3302206.1 hypothetical protein [Candidatus Eisenbacteria bacterium]
MSSPQGRVTGTFSCARTGPGAIDVDFAADADASLEGLALLPNWTIEATLVDGGPGQVNLIGDVTMNTLLGTIEFALGGTIHLDGAPDGILAENQKLSISAVRSGGDDLVIHTRTVVEDGVVVDVEPLVLGENPPPLATVRATPNPLGPKTQIAYTLSGPATGAIRLYAADGRLVRTIESGRFAAGEHRIPFDGRDDSGRRLAAGGYFLRFETDLVQAAAKMFVLH